MRISDWSSDVCSSDLPGEELIALSAGDTVRWVVGDTTSGTGGEQQVHVLVKPVAPDLETNLVITTDRRAYHLEMESTKGTYMASVSWHYPHDELRSEEHTSELQSLMRNSYAVFCLKQKKTNTDHN